MIILTTISPTNIDNQQQAVNSWLKLGHTVYSLNSKNDIEQIKSNFDIEFVEVENLGTTEFKKDYVRLNAFTDWIKENGSALIINSDIEIYGDVEIKDEPKTIQVFSRNDYAVNINNSIKFNSGFDAFYLTKEFCMWIPKSRLVIGQCHWDYYLPLMAIKHGFILKSPDKSNMYHKKHKLQYDGGKWKQTARIFAIELGLTGNAHYDSQNAHKEIKSKIQNYQ